MSWKPIAIVLILVAAAAASLGFFWPFGNKDNVLRLPGVVETQEVRLGSKVGGRVAEIAVQEGQLVQPGDLIVRFDVPELQAQRLQQEARLQSTLAELEKARNGPRPEEKRAAQAALDAAEARVERMVAGWRDEEKEQARSELESAQADLKLAREEYERAERVFRQGAGSRSDYDVARGARDRAQGRMTSTKARYDMLMHGNRPEDIKEAKAELARAKANLDLLLAGTRTEDIALAESRVAEARGKLSEIEANLKEAEVRAPEKAVVEVLAVRKGDVAAPNQPVVRVLRANDLWVKVYVSEFDLGKIRLNQPVRVTIDSYPGRVFEGTVMQIASDSEFTPRNVQSPDERRHQVFAVKVRVQQPTEPEKQVFKSGMAAEVTVPLYE